MLVVVLQTGASVIENSIEFPQKIKNRTTIYIVCIYMHAMDYYTAIKKNETMPFAATWMEIETIILSEVSQKVKDLLSF